MRQAEIKRRCKMNYRQRADAINAEVEEWLKNRGYKLLEKGPHNPATGRGWYSHPREYGRGHVRVRINPGGFIILRDPGCRMELFQTVPGSGGMEEMITPNSKRVDHGPHTDLKLVQGCVENFESRPAYTIEEARTRFLREEVVCNG